MKFVALTLSSLVLLVAAPANARIIDLKCTYLAPSKQGEFEFRIDDDKKTASWESGAGPQVSRAVFTAGSISFSIFSIDRTTLKMSRRNADLYVKAWGLPPIEYAQCEIVERKTQI